MQRRNGTFFAIGLTTAATLTGCGLVGGEDSSKFCQLLKEQLPAYPAEPLKAIAPDAGASAWKAHFDLVHQRNQKIIDAAPSELKSATINLQAANDQLAAFYAAAEYQPGQIDSGALAQLLHDTGYAPAVTDVTKYAKSTCKIDADSAGG